eukprot:1394461-Amphidinium_carterae.1
MLRFALPAMRCLLRLSVLVMIRTAADEDNDDAHKRDSQNPKSNTKQRLQRGLKQFKDLLRSTTKLLRSTWC